MLKPSTRSPSPPPAPPLFVKVEDQRSMEKSTHDQPEISTQNSQQVSQEHPKYTQEPSKSTQESQTSLQSVKASLQEFKKPAEAPISQPTPAQAPRKEEKIVERVEVPVIVEKEKVVYIDRPVEVEKPVYIDRYVRTHASSVYIDRYVRTHAS